VTVAVNVTASPYVDVAALEVTEMFVFALASVNAVLATAPESCPMAISRRDAPRY
jgi:hypothetical protein